MMSARLTLPQSVVLAAIVFGASGVRAIDAGSTVTLNVQGRSNAFVSLDARGSFVAASWSATRTDGVADVFVAASHDGGRTFGAPVRVNDVAGDARVSGEQPPRVALVPRTTGDPSIVVVWTSKGSSGTRLISSRSDDGGKSFSRAAAVPGGEASGNRGWEAVAVDRDRQVVAIWLDHRDLVEPTGSAAPMRHDGQAHTGHGSADGVARAQRSKLYFTRFDSSAMPITGGVCYCCKTALAAAGDGSIYAAWRHVYPGNIRDIAFTMSRDGGRTFAPPVRVSEDRWALDGCPENGPSIAADSRGTVHVVWPTLVSGNGPAAEPTLALFHAFSRDGKRFSTRQRIPTEGTPRHPQLAIGPNGTLVVTADEQLNATRRVVVWEGSPDRSGVIRFARASVESAERSDYPAVASVSDGFVVAWTAGQPTAIRVKRFAVASDR